MTKLIYNSLQENRFLNFYWIEGFPAQINLLKQL